MVINNKSQKRVNTFMKLRVTPFVNFVHRPGFEITRKHDVSETGYVFESLFYSYLEFRTMDSPQT
jgi:hypothetical protein